jgi:hypothetical protein
MRSYPSPVTATIAAGDATGLSNAIDIGAAKYLGMIMPAAWTAAVLTFQSCDTLAGTYQNVYDASGEVSMAVSVSVNRTLNVAMWSLAPWRFLKLRSGTSATPVTQSSSRVITIVMKPSV